MSRQRPYPPPPFEGRTLCAIVVLALVLAVPRFAHTTPDSAYYIALADYFKGDVARENLAAPFAWRWLVPWLAARLPILTSANAIATVSLGATVAAFVLLDRLLAHLLPTRAARYAALGAAMLSFPTVNYGAAVLTDSAAFLVLVVAACAMVERRFLRLGLLMAVGVCVRETTLLLLPATALYYALQQDRRGLIAAGFSTLTALSCTVAVRSAFSDLPPYHWVITPDRLMGNLTRPISWATVLLTLVPMGILAVGGMRRWRALPGQTQHFVIAMGLPAFALLAYSTLTAFMSGRFVWPLYLALAPLAAMGATARGIEPKK